MEQASNQSCRCSPLSRPFELAKTSTARSPNGMPCGLVVVSVQDELEEASEPSDSPCPGSVLALEAFELAHAKVLQHTKACRRNPCVESLLSDADVEKNTCAYVEPERFCRCFAD